MLSVSYAEYVCMFVCECNVLGEVMYTSIRLLTFACLSDSSLTLCVEHISSLSLPVCVVFQKHQSFSGVARYCSSAFMKNSTKFKNITRTPFLMLNSHSVSTLLSHVVTYPPTSNIIIFSSHSSQTSYFHCYQILNNLLTSWHFCLVFNVILNLQIWCFLRLISLMLLHFSLASAIFMKQNAKKTFATSTTTSENLTQNQAFQIWLGSCM